MDASQLSGTWKEAAEEESMKALMRRGFALLLVLCLLPLAGSTAEDRVLNGVVRVWLSSMGQISQVDMTVSGSYSLDGTVATALPSGTSLRVTMNSRTGRSRYGCGRL